MCALHRDHFLHVPAAFLPIIIDCFESAVKFGHKFIKADFLLFIELADLDSQKTCAASIGMGKCFSLLGGDGGRNRSGSVNMGNEGKFVSPDALEASIFSERGIPPSKPQQNPQSDIGQFTLTADVGTFDKLAHESNGLVEGDSAGVIGANGSKTVRKGESQTLMRRCFPPVGLLLFCDMPPDDMEPSQRQKLLEQIRDDIATAVSAAKDRIRVIALDRDRAAVQLNILADLGNGDSRSPMQLACDLVEQVPPPTPARLRRRSWPRAVSGQEPEKGTTKPRP